MKKNNQIPLLAAAVSLLSAFALAQGLWFEALLGWSLGLLSNVAGRFLKKIDLRSEEGMRRFSVFSFLRLMGLLISVFLVITFLKLDQMVFVVALMISYAIFMIADVIAVYQSGEGLHERRI